MPPPLLGRILDAVRARFGVARGAEVTIEADPGTFDAALLAEYRRLGFTRLSVGVQSFDDALLRACGRTHSASEARAALRAAAAAGFESWSLDLMSGLPGLTRGGWRATLAAALEAAAGGARGGGGDAAAVGRLLPPHVSVYDLQLEEGTPFARRYAPGAAPLPPDDAAADMFADAAAILAAAGYEHYEVSSYALPGHRSRHNQVYWRRAPYYAFGVGAASYLEGRRFSRPKALAAYEEWVGAFEAKAAEGGGGGGSSGGGAGGGGGGGGGEGACLERGVPGAELARETRDERLLDAVMLSLRTADGLDLAALAAEFGRGAADALGPALRKHEALGLVALTRRGGGGGGSAEGGSTESGGGGSAEGSSAEGGGEIAGARLTDPRGFLLSNEVISDLFAAL